MSDDELDEDVFIVERILAERYDPVEQKAQYLIKWENYGDEECTWEPVENFNTKEVLLQWRDQKQRGDALDSNDLARIQNLMDDFQARMAQDSAGDGMDIESDDDLTDTKKVSRPVRDPESPVDHSRHEKDLDDMNDKDTSTSKPIMSVHDRKGTARPIMQQKRQDQISTNTRSKSPTRSNTTKPAEKESRAKSSPKVVPVLRPPVKPIKAPQQFFAPALSQTTKASPRERTRSIVPAEKPSQLFRSGRHMHNSRKKQAQEAPALPINLMPLNDDERSVVESAKSAKQPEVAPLLDTSNNFGEELPQNQQAIFPSPVEKNKSFLFFDESDDDEIQNVKREPFEKQSGRLVNEAPAQLTDSQASVQVSRIPTTSMTERERKGNAEDHTRRQVTTKSSKQSLSTQSIPMLPKAAELRKKKHSQKASIEKATSATPQSSKRQELPTVLKAAKVSEKRDQHDNNIDGASVETVDSTKIPAARGPASHTTISATGILETSISKRRPSRSDLLADANVVQQNEQNRGRSTERPQAVSTSSTISKVPDPRSRSRSRSSFRVPESHNTTARAADQRSKSRQRSRPPNRPIAPDSIHLDRPIQELTWTESGTCCDLDQLHILLAFARSESTETRRREVRRFFQEQCPSGHIHHANKEGLVKFCDMVQSRPAAIIFDELFPIALLEKPFIKLIEANDQVTCWEINLEDTTSNNIRLTRLFPIGTVSAFVESSFVDLPMETLYLLRSIRDSQTLSNNPLSRIILPPGIQEVLIDALISSKDALYVTYYRELLMILQNLENLSHQQNSDGTVEDDSTSFGLLKPSWKELYYDIPEQTQPLTAAEKQKRDDRKDELMMEYIRGWGHMHLKMHRHFHVYVQQRLTQNPIAYGHIRLKSTQGAYGELMARKKGSVVGGNKRVGNSKDSTPKTPVGPVTPKSPWR